MIITLSKFEGTFDMDVSFMYHADWNVGLANTLYTIAGFITLLSFLARDMLWLRSVIMIAFMFNAIAGAILGMWHVIIWDVLFIAVQLVHIGWLMLERKPYFLPRELKSLWSSFFSSLTPGEFKKLWHYGTRVTFKNTLICTNGEPAESLRFIYSGRARVIKNNHDIATLATGAFVGEMSFLTQEVVSADVLADGQTELITWSQDELRHLSITHPAIYTKLLAILGVDLVHKLQQQSVLALHS